MATKQKPAATKATAATELLNIADITPSPLNYRGKVISADSLKELADSIVEQGVIQAIVVRPFAEGKYELVVGERRYLASKLAKQKTIPSQIRDLTDEQVQEIQLVENLQRENPHPMAEAKGIAMLLQMKDKKYTIPEIAAKLAKSQAYVYQRIKLNCLIAEFEPIVFADKITIADALKIAQVHPDAQTEIYNALFEGWEDEDWELDNLEWSLRDFKLKLENARFNIKDKSLIKAAGACIGCQFNTGTNASLFPDEDNEARCTNYACFNKKTELSIYNAIIKEVSNNPNLPLAFDDQSLAVELLKRFEEKMMGREIVYKNVDFFSIETYPELPKREDYDYEDTEEENEAAYQDELKDYNEEIDRLNVLESKGSLRKVLMMDGGNRDQLVLISSEREQKSTNNQSGRSEFKAADFQQAVKEKTLTPQMISNEVLRLEQKEQRSQELDAEKLHLSIFETLKEDRSANSLDFEFGHNDNAVSAYLVYEALGYNEKDFFCKMVFDSSSRNVGDEKLVNFFFSPTRKHLALLIRLAMLSNSSAKYHTTLCGMMLRKLAEGTPTVDVKALVQKQQDIANLRLDKYHEKLSALDDQLEKLTPPVEQE